MDKLIGFDEDVRNIEPLGDTPMISGEELRQAFDKAGVDIKEYLNSVLLPKVNDEIIKGIDENTSAIDKISNNLVNINDSAEKSYPKIYLGESAAFPLKTSPKIIFSKTVPTTSNYGANLPIGSIVFVY